MRKKQILYLLGAGASAGKLPMIGNFHERVVAQISKIKEIDLNKLSNKTTLNLPGVYGQYLNELCYLDNLLRNSDTPSVDVMAKSFKVSGRTYEYFRLKKIYSLFLLLEQKWNFHDNRYTQFISDIYSTSENKLPSNVRMLSWNYDNQFELAYSNFTHSSDFSLVRKEIGYRSIESKDDIKGFSFTKINGSVDMRNLVHLSDMKQIEDKYQVDPTIVQLNDFLVVVNDTYNNLNHKPIEFAWEKEISTENFHMFRNVTDLVVIGYSFPNCNNDIDKMLFSSIASLDNVYIQCGNSSEEVKQRLESRRYQAIEWMKNQSKHTITTLPNINQFHLIYE